MPAQNPAFPADEQTVPAVTVSRSTTPITTSMPAIFAASQSWSVVGLGISTAWARYSAIACHVSGRISAKAKNG